MDFLSLFENDFLGIIPESFIAFAACLLLVYGVNVPTHPSNALVVNVGWLSILTLSTTILLLVTGPIHEMVFFFNCLRIDSFSVFLQVIILLSVISVILLSLDYLVREGIHSFEYMVLILLSSCSMILMVSSYDLIGIYLTIEFQSLAFYVIAASKQDSEFSTEAGLKYFVLGAFASGILLFGCTLIYGFTGLTNLEDLSQLLTGIGSLPVISSSGLLVGILFLCVGFLFKLTAAPFHMWAPDVYQGAPTSVTAFFAICPKLAILGLFAKILLFTFYDLLNSWQSILLLCSLASMCVGAFGALGQTDIKRLLAYSSIGHIGYLLIGVACGTIDGLQSMLVYMVIYMTMSLTTFGVVLSIRTKNGQAIKTIQDLAGLGASNPALAITLSLTMFSMAGIPPLAGFMSKFYLFFAALSASLYPLAVVGVLTSVVSSFYYIRFIKIMYFDKSEQDLQFESLDASKAWVISITFAVTVFLAAYPAPIFLITEKLALGFCI
jgi:proton-translocating NADH-quinone oxidoreductase chain N